MSLTQQQIQANVEAIKRQGGTFEDVNEYLKSQGRNQQIQSQLSGGQETSQGPGILGKIGDFLAPTATQSVRDLRSGEGITGRQVAGSALEIGSFVVPAGAIARGAGLLGRGAKRLAQRSRFADDILGKASETASRVGRTTRNAMGIGGVSGGMWAGGQEVADPDASIKDIAGGAAIGGAMGAVGGAIIAPVTQLGVMGTKGIANFTSKSIRKVQNNLRPRDRDTAIDSLTEAYQKSFFDDRSAPTKKLKLITNKSRRVGGPDTPEGVLRELSSEGYTPTVKGALADMDPILSDLGTRIGTLSEGMTPTLQQIKTRTPIETLRKNALDAVAQRGDIDQASARREVNKIFTEWTNKYGKNISAVQLNEMRTEAGRRSIALRRDKDVFRSDASNEVRDSLRTTLLDLDESGAISQSLAEQTRLYRMQDVARVVDDRQINVGFLGSSMGRYLGVVGGAMAGFGASGPGALVIAGIMANLGANQVAKIMRQTRFTPALRRTIQEGFDQDQQLLNRMLDDATPQDQVIIRNFVQKGRDATPTDVRPGDLDLRHTARQTQE
jgi:hypothetical protein